MTEPRQDQHQIDEERQDVLDTLNAADVGPDSVTLDIEDGAVSIVAEGAPDAR
jgi:hypothetical protein